MIIDKYYILSYMNLRCNYDKNLTLDDFDISHTSNYNGNALYDIISRTGKFCTWSLTYEYYKDVILPLMLGVRDNKFKELLQ